LKYSDHVFLCFDSSNSSISKLNTLSKQGMLNITTNYEFKDNLNIFLLWRL